MDSDIKEGGRLSENESRFILAMACLFGVTTLLPWSMFTICTDFFMTQFVDFPATTILPLTYTIAICVSQWILVYLTRGWDRSRSIYVSYAILSAALMIGPALCLFWPNQMISFILLNGVFACEGIADGLLQNSLLGFMVELGSRYSSGLYIGQAAAGTLISFSRLFLLFLMPTTGSQSPTNVIVLHTLASIFLVASLLLFRRFKDNSIVLRVAANERLNSPNFDESTPLLEDKDKTPSSILDVIRQAKGVLFVTGYALLVTLAIFPSLLFYPLDYKLPISDGWYVCIYKVIYDSSDLTGRILSTFFCTNKVGLYFLSLFRTVLYVCFLLLAIHAETMSSVLWLSMVLTLLVGLTHGYSVSASLSLTSQEVSFQDRDRAGFLQGVSAETGMLAGSIVAFAVIEALQ